MNYLSLTDPLAANIDRITTDLMYIWVLMGGSASVTYDEYRLDTWSNLGTSNTPWPFDERCVQFKYTHIQLINFLESRGYNMSAVKVFVVTIENTVKVFSTKEKALKWCNEWEEGGDHHFDFRIQELVVE
jgi:hypothetical protein